MSQNSGATCQARLFHSGGRSRELDCAALAEVRLDDDCLLWVDLCRPDEALLQSVWSQCRLPDAALAWMRGGSNPGVQKEAAHFWARAVAVTQSTTDQADGAVLHLIAGDNLVVTVHDAPLDFLDELREREGTGSDVGALCAESFVASLLDWQLSTYFAAVADFEMSVERLETDILERCQGDCLPELRRLRRRASRLRRMLAPHRALFGALSRPDFRPSESQQAERHFGALDTRFERAMDMVENARDMIIGSFDLFTSQTALQTNNIMQVLTFVTVIVGVLATMAGVLGMNFDAQFFKTQDQGFWIALAVMLAFSLSAVALGRWRKWF